MREWLTRTCKVYSTRFHLEFAVQCALCSKMCFERSEIPVLTYYTHMYVCGSSCLFCNSGAAQAQTDVAEETFEVQNTDRV